MSATVQHIGNSIATPLRRLRPVAGQHVRSHGSAGAVALFFVFVAFGAMSALLMVVPEKPQTVLALAVGLTIALAIIRWPVTGTYIVAIVAIMFDMLPSKWVHTFVSDLGVFRNLSYIGLPEGVVVSLFELVVALSLGSALVHRFHAHKRLVRGPLFWPIMGYAAIVIFGEVNGILSGGDFKISLWEIRPLVYLVVLYVLAVNTITESWQIRAFLWVTILTIVARCFEGVVRYVTMPGDVRATASVILDHDDSLFLALAFGLLLAVVLWRKYLPKALLWTLVGLAPLALYVISINHRRAAYMCLVLILAAMTPPIWSSLRSKASKRRLAYILGAVIAVGTLYTLAFWNRGGTIGEPAQAIRSVVQPGERDYLSNLYRVQEDTNLQFTIGLSPLIGYGFGKPFVVVVPMVDLTKDWPLQFYTPHNNMLWLWMRMGIVGFIAFWVMIGSAIILLAACLRLALVRLRFLESLESGPGSENGEAGRRRAMASDSSALRVVRLTQPASLERARTAAGKLRRLEMREAAELIVLAMLVLSVLASLLGIAVVDQGLMSFRLGAYAGLALGVLAGAWELHRLKYRLPSDVDLESLEKEDESESAGRRRMRYIARPRVA